MNNYRYIQDTIKDHTLIVNGSRLMPKEVWLDGWSIAHNILRRVDDAAVSIKEKVYESMHRY